MLTEEGKKQLTREISKPVRKFLAFFFLGICALLVYCTLTTDENSIFPSLLVIVGLPLFLLSLGLLFARKKERQRGFFSGITLFLTGCLLLSGVFLISDLGFLERGIMLSMSTSCFLLASRRWRLKKQNRKWFQ